MADGWQDGWRAGGLLWLEAVSGEVDNGAIHVRYGRARRTVRRDYPTSMHMDWAAYPFLDMRDILCTAPAAIVRPPAASKAVPSGLQKLRASRPEQEQEQEQASNWLTAQVVSWLWADGLPAQLAVGSIISCALQPR